MNNKYAELLLTAANDLDSVLVSNKQYYDYITDIIDNKNETTVRIILQNLAKIKTNDNIAIGEAVNKLKNTLIVYLGYIKIREICEYTDNIEKEDKRTLSELLQELNELIGLKNVKEKVNDLIAYQRVLQLRKKQGLKYAKSTMHMAFTGNPGTGKTTVARIVGYIYKQLGLLSKGQFIEVSRTDLIAGYQGQTALKVKGVIEKAKGGVLFIDEAYSITENEHSDSYGRECLTELTKALEDHRDDLVVIVAGYTEPMKIFFNSNPGLKSRFNTFIEFDDYNAEELFKILNSMCKKNDYALTKAAEQKIKNILIAKVMHKSDEFANGRLVRNMYDEIIMNQARRLVTMVQPSKKELMEIIESDVAIN